MIKQTWKEVWFPETELKCWTDGMNHIDRMKKVLAQGWYVVSFYCPEGQSINTCDEVTIKLKKEIKNG